MKRPSITIFCILIAILAFQACHTGGSGLSEEEQKEYAGKGKEIAAQVFTALSGELASALERGGVEEAIAYCNLNALDITARLSEENEAVIARKALYFRNPQNALTEEERIIYERIQTRLEEGVAEPEVRKEGEGIVFYHPIVMQEMCLRCHGDVEKEIGFDNYELIRKYYPEDKATGFRAGDLRGMWRIEFASS